MPIGKLTDPAAVEAAMAEFDRLGRDEFLARHRYGRSRSYFLISNGRRYDAKAIAGVACGYQFPERGPLPHDDFVSGAATVAPKLRALGFEVVGPTSNDASASPMPELSRGRTYSWDELGEVFAFDPAWLGAVGGMAPRPALNALLLITHPGGARTIDYGDYWDDNDLIYSGRGKSGDQKLEGANRDVAQNTMRLLVFEKGGAKQLLFLGEAECVDHWTATAADVDGNERRVLRFRLRFPDADTDRSRPEGPRALKAPRQIAGATNERAPRPFDPERPPTPAKSRSPDHTPEETLARQEKARQGHHILVADLARWLESCGWSSIEEIPAAVDLWGRAPSTGERVIFEVKTVTLGSELARTRAAVSQLLEYRFFYGHATDRLCLVTNEPISDRRCRLLDSLGIAVIWRDDTDGFAAGSRVAADIL